MVSHIKETDVNVPYKDGDYFYYSRWEAGKQYQIYARKKGSLETAEQLTVDVNELAKGEKFMALGAHTISDDGTLLHIPRTTQGSGSTACTYGSANWKRPARYRRKDRSNRLGR